ncbi:MAG: hypothetical protein ACJ8AW_31695, partial [Rhodopila sp.]
QSHRPVRRTSSSITENEMGIEEHNCTQTGSEVGQAAHRCTKLQEKTGKMLTARRSADACECRKFIVWHIVAQIYY